MCNASTVGFGRGRRAEHLGRPLTCSQVQYRMRLASRVSGAKVSGFGDRVWGGGRRPEAVLELHGAAVEDGVEERTVKVVGVDVVPLQVVHPAPDRHRHRQTDTRESTHTHTHRQVSTCHPPPPPPDAEAVESDSQTDTDKSAHVSSPSR
eukprot:2476903-Rhodomonas_salina.1